jgi:ribosome-associated translation inhibitor RaiA
MGHTIDVTFDGVRRMLSDELREHAQKRLTFALRRFQDQIRHVRLRFEDVNGPRRGVDARCLVIAQLTNGQRLVVEATTAWPSASVTQAAKQLAEVLRRSKGRT